MWEKARTAWHWSVCISTLKSWFVGYSNSIRWALFPQSMRYCQCHCRCFHEDVFTKGKVPQHASKAAWSSKIGNLFVLQHAREGLNGGIYGSIYGHFHKDPSHPGNTSGRRPTIPTIPSTNSQNPYWLDIILPHHGSTLSIPRPLQLYMVHRHRANRRTRRHILHLLLMQNHLHIRRQSQRLIQPLARRTPTP